MANICAVNKKNENEDCLRFRKEKSGRICYKKRRLHKMGPGPIFIIFASITKKLAKKMGEVVGFVPK